MQGIATVEDYFDLKTMTHKYTIKWDPEDADQCLISRQLIEQLMESVYKCRNEHQYAS